MDRARRVANVVARRLGNQLEEKLVDLGIQAGSAIGTKALGYLTSDIGGTASWAAKYAKSRQPFYDAQKKKMPGANRRYRKRKGRGSMYRRRKMYRSRRRYGRGNPRNLRGAMRAVRIPRARPSTLMPRRLQIKVSHYFADEGETGLSYSANGVTDTLTLQWMHFGRPLNGKSTLIPQQFINLSKIYRKYLITWVKLTMSFPTPGPGVTRSTENLLWYAQNASDYSAVNPFYTMMNLPGRRYMTTKPGDSSGPYFVKWRQFMRPNRVLGVDWRAYAGDEANWGLLGDGTDTDAGTEPPNAVDLQLWRRAMSTSNASFNSGPVRYHWTAKVQVWSADEDWVNGGIISQVAALRALQATPGVEIVPVDEEPDADGEDEEEKTEVDEPQPVQ